MFRSSYKIGSIMGIPIYLHYSFLLILPFLAWSFGDNLKAVAAFSGIPAFRLSASPYLWGLGIALALFGSVLLHELGHSWVALRKHIQIRGITLMLFGGVAQLEEMPTGPGEEARIALAGPVVSFLVGGAFYVLLPLAGRLEHPNLAFSCAQLGFINLFLGVFNLLPAFPMDGGRILRSLLARRRPFVAATKTAANVGKVFAFAFGAYGLLNGNLILVLIAYFVYMGASQEYHYSVMRATLDGYRVRDLMTGDVVTVNAAARVRDLVEQMMRERHFGYPVMREGRLVGCVTMEDVQKVPPEAQETARVSEIMSPDPVVVGPDDDIYVALKRMSERDIGRLPVVEGARLVGILSRSDVMRGFAMRQLRPPGGSLQRSEE